MVPKLVGVLADSVLVLSRAVVIVSRTTEIHQIWSETETAQQQVENSPVSSIVHRVEEIPLEKELVE